MLTIYEKLDCDSCNLLKPEVLNIFRPVDLRQKFYRTTLLSLIVNVLKCWISTIDEKVFCVGWKGHWIVLVSVWFWHIVCFVQIPTVTVLKVDAPTRWNETPETETGKLLTSETVCERTWGIASNNRKKVVNVVALVNRF